MPTETRKLVKARPKALELMPDWAACCDEREAQMVRLSHDGEIILVLDSRFVADTECPDCGRYVKDTKYVLSVDGHILAFEWLDLDEGAYTDAH